MSDLEQRVKLLEDKVKILEETLETLKNMGISEQMENYIKQKKHTLKMVNLINAVSDKPELDFAAEKEKVERISLAKKSVDSQIQKALTSADSFSEQIPVDTRYFDYEEESGMITDYWESRFSVQSYKDTPKKDCVSSAIMDLKPNELLFPVRSMTAL